MLLEEFDEEREAILNPEAVVRPLEGMPKVCVSCFSKKLMDEVLKSFPFEEVGHISSSNGYRYIYKINYEGKEIGFYLSSVGSSACCVNYEEMTARGMEKLVLFGTCGCLYKDIKDCSVIIPTFAIRDEGTSYHYMEASDEIEVNSKENIGLFKSILDTHGYFYTEGKAWTTDAVYRETKAKMEKRKAMGAVCVDMECSAMAAVSKFREKEFFQFFYGADNLDGVKWDKRSLSNDKKLDAKLKIALLALEMAHNMI